MSQRTANMKVTADILLIQVERTGRRYGECLNGLHRRAVSDLSAELAELDRASEAFRAAVSALSAHRMAA